MDGTAAAEGMINMFGPLDALSKEVQRLSSETSEKYVPAPSKGQIQQNLLVGLKRFRNSVRWKFYWLEEERKREEGKPYLDGEADSKKEILKPEPRFDKGSEGLGTGLKKPNTANSVPMASKEVEAFLDDVVHTLLKDLNKGKEIPETNKAREIRLLAKSLQEEESQVVVPTDKTNSFRIVKKEKYISWVNNHLESAASEISTDKLQFIFGEAEKLLGELDDTLSEDERGFVKAKMETRSVPTPKLLIKDHKKKNGKGEFPTRLVVPATNFTAGFSKAGYLGIKNIFDKNGIDYSRSTIIQASQLKSRLEKL